jgi:AcrR family transcriptional regulator
MRKKQNSDERCTVKERLLYAGLRTFAQKGYAGVTIRSLCNECDSNLAAIKYYFGDKRGFYCAVHDFARDLMHNQAVQLLDGHPSDDPWELLRAHVNLMLSHSYNNLMFQAAWLYIRELLDTTSGELVAPSEDEMNNHNRFHERLRSLFASLLGAEAATPKNILLLEHTYFSMTIFLVINTHISGHPKPPPNMQIIQESIEMEELADYILESLKNSVRMMQLKASGEAGDSGV